MTNNTSKHRSADRSLRYMATSAATDLLTTAVAFGTGLLIARTLGAHDRGVYTLVTTVAMLMAYAIGMGQFESLLARNATPNGSNQSTAARLGAIGSVTLLIISFVSGESSFSYYALFPILWGVMQIGLARAAIRQDWSWVYLRATPNAIQITLTGSLWLTGNLTVPLALAAMLAGMACTFAIDQAVNGRFPPAAGHSALSDVRASFSHHLLNLPRMANYRGPIVILGLFSTPTQVGLFAVASAIAALVPTLTWSVTQNLLVLVAKGHRGAHQMQRILTAAGYFSSLVGAVVLYFYGENLLAWLYGPDLSHSWPALVAVLSVQGMWIHSGLLQVRYRAANLAHWAAGIELTGLAIMAATLYLTLDQGYMAAAYGTIATCGTTLIASWIILRSNPRRFGTTNVN